MFTEQYTVRLEDDERHELDGIVASPTAKQRDVMRAKIVLQSAAGIRASEVARRLGTSLATVCLWKRRFVNEGLPGLIERKRPGRPQRIDTAVKEEIVQQAMRGPGTRVSTRGVARTVGVSKDTVRRVWQAGDLKPHLTRTFKLSNDPHFEEKFWDVIGLYLDPPEQAVVLCCDEKSQCQALERTQPGLPLGVGHIQTSTHDYYRHGTVTLFAALDYLTGKITSRTEQRHRHTEWLKFLKQIDRDTPKGLDIHIILDNYCTHKHKKVKEWLAKHPRFHLHFTPTSSSWLNLVERFFRDISEDVIRRGSFSSTRQLADAILEYLAERNAAPTRYVWRKDGNEILEKIMRARERLASTTDNKANYAPLH